MFYQHDYLTESSTCLGSMYLSPLESESQRHFSCPKFQSWEAADIQAHLTSMSTPRATMPGGQASHEPELWDLCGSNPGFCLPTVAAVG